MLRILMQPGTPYFDTRVLSATKGYGYGLWDYEYILPPGLEWNHKKRSEIDPKEDIFPDEIDETPELEEGEISERQRQRNYSVEYWSVNTGAGGAAKRRAPAAS